MAEPKPIVFNNFQKGIGASPYVGFEIMRGLNITDKPGIAFPNFALVKESSTTITDQIFQTRWDNQGQLWGVSAAKLYKRATNGTWSSIALPGGGSTGTHHGIAFWGANATKTKGYIFLFAGTSIDLLDLADETTWSKGWASLGGAAVTKNAFVASNNILYINKGTNYGFASIAEYSFGSFDGTSGGTSSVITQAALTLPADTFVVGFTELGSKLLILGSSSKGDNGAMIFPWNKVDADFDIPIKLYEDGDYKGWQAVVIGLKAYLQCGKGGQWYVTNGTEAVPFAKMPISVMDIAPSSFEIYPDAVDVVNGLIYFAVSTSAVGTGLYQIGIYSLNPSTGAINFEHTISTGNVGTLYQVIISSIKSLGNKQFLCTWVNGLVASDTFGVDKVDSNRYTTDLTYLYSPFLRVGSKLNKRCFSNWEVQLAKPLASGDSVKLYYRTAQNGSWLSIINDTVEDAAGDTLSFISVVGEQSGELSRLISCENIQVKCALNKGAELLEIRID